MSPIPRNGALGALTWANIDAKDLLGTLSTGIPANIGAGGTNFRATPSLRRPFRGETPRTTPLAMLAKAVSTTRDVFEESTGTRGSLADGGQAVSVFNALVAPSALGEREALVHSSTEGPTRPLHVWLLCP